MARRVRFSIRLKIIAVVSALISSSLGLYLFVALNLFNDDKTAYVFETGLNTAQSMSAQVSHFLSRLLRDSLSLYNQIPVERLIPEKVHGSPATFEEIFDVSPGDIDRLEAQVKEATARFEKSGAPAVRLALAKALVDLGEALMHRDATQFARAYAAWEKAGGKGDLPRRGREGHEVLSRAVNLIERLMKDEASKDRSTLIKLEALLLLGRAHEARNEPSLAEAVYNELMSRHGKSRHAAEAALRLGHLLHLDRAFEESAHAFEKATVFRDAKKAAFAHYRKGYAHLRLGQYAAAAKSFTKVARESPSPKLKKRVLEDAVELFAEWGRQDRARAFYKGVPDAARYLARVDEEAGRLRAKRTPQGGSLLEERKLLRDLFLGDPDMVELSVHEEKGGRIVRLARLVDASLLAAAGLSPTYLERLDRVRPIPFERATSKTPLVLNTSLRGGIPLLTIVRQDPATRRYLVVRARMEPVLEIFAKNAVYTSYLVNAAGELFAHRDSSKILSDVNMLEEKYVVDTIRSGVSSGAARQTNRAGEDLIVAHAAVGLFDMLVFSEIKYAKAFEAARNLTITSLYFGIFIISVSMIIGIVFAKTLTGPIDRLFRGTQVIAAGDFKTRVAVKSQDEIGVLADSFNFMAGRIVDLLEQEKEKVRMEEELKVAKLVQESFFPADHLVAGRLDIAAFYTPAEECGGDWWGCVQNGNKTLILIGDATGHGVPAALITATAASCTATIEELARENPALLESPATILRLLNKAVYQAAQGKILMTFFAALIDQESGQITYSNASHNPPYLYKFSDDEPKKKNIKPLLEAVGKRLGHDPDSEYVDDRIEITPKDVLVFFTDGFLECKSPQGEEYGGRKFLKSILKNVKTDAEEMRANIVKEARDFFSTQPLADDLTLVVAKLLPPAENVISAA